MDPYGDAGKREIQESHSPATNADRAKGRNGVSTLKNPIRDMVRLEGGTFLMGTEDPALSAADGEGPVHPVQLPPFFLDAQVVSNARFKAFVEDTGYQTEAERFGWSFVFGGLLPRDFPPTSAVVQAPWWRQVFEASWKAPEGPQSTIEGRMNHPAIHVSWNDAMAFCAWAGLRLPTEAEWEYAARGGLERKRFPWGDELTPAGAHRMNVWQGDFPARNTAEDGYQGTAPVEAFPPNGFGLYNMTGNVWEWCSDWYSPTYYQKSPRKAPQGPPSGERKVMRGGSYLCHRSYCDRYRVDARNSNSPDSSTGNLGFRCARDA